MSELPPIDDLRHIADRLRANDIAWVRTRWAAGAFGWLNDRLADGEAVHIGERIDAGDLNALRLALSRLDLPSSPGLFAGSLGAVGTTGTISSAASGSGDALVDAERQRRGRGKGVLWLLPLVVVAALLAVLLTNCADDADDTGTGPVDTLIETTLPPAPETSAAPDTTAAPETTAAATGIPASVIEAAAGHGGFTTLASAIESAGLTDALSGEGPFTVFAPTDDAFSALPDGVLDRLLDPANAETLTAVLRHHVVAGRLAAADLTAGDLETIGGTTLAVALDGGTVKVGDATVTTPDISAANGIVHEIDRVLLPDTVDLAALGSAAPPTSDAIVVEETTTVPAPAAASGDIVETAAAAGTFTTLAAALEAAGLTGTLKGPGPFTVFAPTDEAFAKVPVDVRDALLQPSGKDALTKVLTYHVLPGAVMAKDLTSGPVTTAEGQQLTVAVDGSTVKVGDATVTTPDVAATNGVIHVVDAVLIPPDLDIDALLAAAAPVSVGAPESLTVYFASGSASLNAEARDKITGAVTQLKGLAAGTKVNIIGHADNTGNAAANQALSLRRAEAVLAALRTGLGADASKITFDVAAVGDTQPDADLAKSRKVTIEIRK